MTTEDQKTEMSTGIQTEDSANISANEDQANISANEDQASQKTDKENSPSASENEISALTKQLSIEKDKVLRLSAEFENYKKRKQREIDEFKKFANETVFKQLLSVVDNLERAIAAVPRNQGQDGEVQNSEGLLGGVEMIHKEILTILDNFHVCTVDAQDQPFDHNFHQAVTQEETNEVPDKTVIRVLQKGYAFHDRLLRPAMVVVSKKPAEDNQETDETK